MDVVQNMVSIIIYTILNARNGNMPLNTLIIGSSVTSVSSYIRYYCAYNNLSKNCYRAVACVII